MGREERGQLQARRSARRLQKATSAFGDALAGLASRGGRGWNGQGSRNGRAKPPAYSALSLLRYGLTGEAWPRVWREPDLARSYDVVIVGAGVHGLATAYYLAARHGISKVAVLDKGYVGGGGSGRNTAILRSN